MEAGVEGDRDRAAAGSVAGRPAVGPGETTDGREGLSPPPGAVRSLLFGSSLPVSARRYESGLLARGAATGRQEAAAGPGAEPRERAQEPCPLPAPRRPRETNRRPQSRSAALTQRVDRPRSRALHPSPGDLRRPSAPAPYADPAAPPLLPPLPSCPARTRPASPRRPRPPPPPPPPPRSARGGGRGGAGRGASRGWRPPGPRPRGDVGVGAAAGRVALARSPRPPASRLRAGTGGGRGARGGTTSGSRCGTSTGSWSMGLRGTAARSAGAAGRGGATVGWPPGPPPTPDPGPRATGGWAARDLPSPVVRPITGSRGREDPRGGRAVGARLALHPARNNGRCRGPLPPAYPHAHTYARDGKRRRREPRPPAQGLVGGHAYLAQHLSHAFRRETPRTAPRRTGRARRLAGGLSDYVPRPTRPTESLPQLPTIPGPLRIRDDVKPLSNAT